MSDEYAGGGVSNEDCQRCGSTTNPIWHAPSPLWNAVMRDPVTLHDEYGIVCPPCFADMAERRGLRFTWHFGPHEDVSHLWEQRDGRLWDSEKCRWVEPVVAQLAANLMPSQARREVGRFPRAHWPLAGTQALDLSEDVQDEISNPVGEVGP